MVNLYSCVVVLVYDSLELQTSHFTHIDTFAIVGISITQSPTAIVMPFYIGHPNCHTSLSRCAMRVYDTGLVRRDVVFNATPFVDLAEQFPSYGRTA